MRKFEILKIEEAPSGHGTIRTFEITYKAIVKKLWVEKKLLMVARNVAHAKEKALERFANVFL